MGRNAAGYMARNVAVSGRHYVSAQLVRQTGVTMPALRACNWLYVPQKLIAAGELDDEWIPAHRAPEWTAQVLAVLALVARAEVRSDLDRVGRTPPPGGAADAARGAGSAGRAMVAPAGRAAMCDDHAARGLPSRATVLRARRMADSAAADPRTRNSEGRRCGNGRTRPSASTS